MYQRILVPLDGSELAEQVLPCVRVLASGGKSEVQLIRVMEAPPSYLADPGQGRYPHQVSASLVSHAQDYLQKVSRPLRDAGVRLTLTIEEGSAAPHIIAEADKTPDALVAMSTHGRSGIARLMLGSVTNKVLQGTENPMLIVRPHEGGSAGEVKLDSIVVPLDGSELSEQSLPHVTELSKALKLRVILVRVTPSAGEYQHYMERHYWGADATAYFGPYEVFSKRADAEAMDYLYDIRERLWKSDVIRVEEELLHGRPADAIVDFARQSPHALVAMTTHGRSGIGRWVLGSVTDSVLRHSDNPVLVVRAREMEKQEG
jgi:nucleotide-binding universal stress UspA family protein